MSGHSTYQPQSGFAKWLEARLPIISFVHGSFVAYPSPRNLNYWWTFGGILSMMLVVQLITGIVLVMHYTPHADMAFKSVELIMRDVNYGWLLRYLHSNGASMFFVAVYIHMFRGLYYGSYKAPREVLWILGVVIYLLMMATGFLGYTLPWGQMSYWGATVITNFFSAFPFIGEPLVTWLWGGYAIGNPTLQRFFSLHYLLPFVIVGVVVLHVWALHVVGQNNPAGVEPKASRDTVPFTPHAVTKDAVGMTLFLLFYCWFVFYTPNFLGHADNYIPANPGVTPAHIVPEWYYLPFYAILRAIPNKLLGVIALFASIIILVFLPWLDTSKVRSARYRPIYRQLFWIFVAVCLGLGWLGAKPAEGGYVLAARILTIYYFAHFLVIMPLVGKLETPRSLPSSISEDVLGRKTVAAMLVAFAVFAAGLVGLAGPASAASEHGAPVPPSESWSFAGPFGRFDKAQLQRGFKIYKEVCSGCHGLGYVAFRNLAEPGGPGYTEAQAAAVAAEYKIKDGPNDAGDMFERPGRLADYFPSPFPNDNAARTANGGALPPDLSIVAKARTYERGFPWFLVDIVTQYQEQGPNYVTALLQGYEDAPADFNLPAGASYNKYFPGHAIGMPQPLSDGQVTYEDGSPQTLAQYAKDVTAFLMWTAEPHLEARKRLGLQVMIFLLVLGGLVYFTKKRVWASVH